MRLILDSHTIDLLESPSAFVDLLNLVAAEADRDATALPASAINERRSIAAAAKRVRDIASMIEKRRRGRSLTVADVRALSPHFIRAQEALTRAKRAWNRMLICGIAGTA